MGSEAGVSVHARSTTALAAGSRVVLAILPDGAHDIAVDSFKPWGSLLEALRERLGDRYRETEDHGALGRAVERTVQSELENASTRDDDVKMG